MAQKRTTTVSRRPRYSKGESTATRRTREQDERDQQRRAATQEAIGTHFMPGDRAGSPAARMAAVLPPEARQMRALAARLGLDRGKLSRWLGTDLASMKLGDAWHLARTEAFSIDWLAGFPVPRDVHARSPRGALAEQFLEQVSRVSRVERELLRLHTPIEHLDAAVTAYLDKLAAQHRDRVALALRRIARAVEEFSVEWSGVAIGPSAALGSTQLVLSKEWSVADGLQLFDRDYLDRLSRMAFDLARSLRAEAGLLLLQPEPRSPEPTPSWIVAVEPGPSGEIHASAAMVDGDECYYAIAGDPSPYARAVAVRTVHADYFWRCAGTTGDVEVRIAHRAVSEAPIFAPVSVQEIRLRNMHAQLAAYGVNVPKHLAPARHEPT